MEQPTPFLFEHWERFECSLSPSGLRALFPSSHFSTVRDGLGVWEGMALTLDGLAAYALVPADASGMGASIWCQPGLAPTHVAGAIRAKVGVRALFMQPNGQPLPAVPA
jgi:hypothetical protein